ncbi:MAG: HupE/UreJ family protein [Pseudomonadota bacterium]
MSFRAALIFWIWLFCAAPADAHDSRVVYVKIEAQNQADDTRPTAYIVSWRMPTVPGTQLIDASFGPNCRGEVKPISYGTKHFHCRADPAQLRLVYSKFAPPLAVLLRIKFAPNQIHQVSFPAGETSLTLPRRERWPGIVEGYSALGFWHILAGWDHLLMLLGLVALTQNAGGWRPLIVVTSGFTLGHSVSLAGGAIGAITVNISAVEVLIALSLLVLAAELMQPSRATWAWRYPISLSIGFGLLHGLGFASALRDIGLPQTHILSALLSFNLGVECGQLVFIAGLAALAKAMQAIHLKALLNRPALYAYPIGIAAAYWTIERAVGIWML